MKYTAEEFKTKVDALLLKLKTDPQLDIIKEKELNINPEENYLYISLQIAGQKTYYDPFPAEIIIDEKEFNLMYAYKQYEIYTGDTDDLFDKTEEEMIEIKKVIYGRGKE